MSAVKRFSIAQLRFAGGKEHDVNYVSEVHYDAALAREAQLRVDRDDDANTFNLAMEKLQRSEAELRDELGAAKGEYDRAVNKVDALVESLTVAGVGECPTPYKSPKQLLAESVAREAALRLELGLTIEAKEHRMDELAAALKELALWKSNHANMVERTKLLRDRPDMPVERIAAFDRMGAIQQRLTVVEQRAVELEGLVEEGFAAIPSQSGYDGLLGRMLTTLKPHAPLAFVLGRSLNKQGLNELVRQFNECPQPQAHPARCGCEVKP